MHILYSLTCIAWVSWYALKKIFRNLSLADPLLLLQLCIWNSITSSCFFIFSRSSKKNSSVLQLFSHSFPFPFLSITFPRFLILLVRTCVLSECLILFFLGSMYLQFKFVVCCSTHSAVQCNLKQKLMLQNSGTTNARYIHAWLAAHHLPTKSGTFLSRHV